MSEEDKGQYQFEAPTIPFASSQVNTAPRIGRIFRLLNLLATGQYTTKRLAIILQVTERSVYRMFATIEEAGFKVEKQLNHYKLNRAVHPDFVKAILKEVHNG